MQGEKTGHSEYSLYKETYSYDGLGRLTDTYLNSVTATTSQTLTDQRIYDGVARLASIVLRTKLRSYDFGKITLSFPHYRHNIGRRQPH